MPKANTTTESKITREQEHEIDLAAALDIKVPLAKEPSRRKPGKHK